MPATNPLVTVGRTASSRSSVAPASVAFEQTRVDPATMVASSPKANPPTQKNGELQNSTSDGPSPRMWLRLRWCPSSPAWVWIAPLGGPVEPDV